MDHPFIQTISPDNRTPLLLHFRAMSISAHFVYNDTVIVIVTDELKHVLT
jgi:hypothetical protein